MPVAVKVLVIVVLFVPVVCDAPELASALVNPFDASSPESVVSVALGEKLAVFVTAR